MTANSHIIRIILKQLREESLSNKELMFLEAWLNNSAENREIFTEATDADGIFAEIKESYSIDLESSWNKLEENLKAGKLPVHALNSNIFRISLWAAVLCGVFLTAIWIKTVIARPSRDKPDVTIQLPKTMKGIDKSMIILDDGTEIEPDTLSKKKTFSKRGVNLHKDPSGAIHFSQSDDDLTVYTRVSNSYSRQTALILSDGSKVWLNPASSIRFPASFTSKDRIVELTGEAYFEVAPDYHRPFKVIVEGNGDAENRPQISVLGTRFAVSTNSVDHLLRTTLVQGNVKISRGSGKGVILQPGQIGLLDTLTNKVEIKKADTNLINSWRSEFFDFDKTPVNQMVNTLSKWYGVEIDTMNCFSKTTFWGSARKDKDDLGAILKLISDGCEVEFVWIKNRYVARIKKENRNLDSIRNFQKNRLIIN